MSFGHPVLNLESPSLSCKCFVHEQFGQPLKICPANSDIFFFLTTVLFVAILVSFAGIKSPDLEQSYRVHSVHATEEQLTSVRHRRFEETEHSSRSTE